MLSLLSRPAAAVAIRYNPQTPSLAPELGRTYALQRHAPTDAGETKLRELTIALVQRLKNDGLPPERVVVAVKTAITRYGDEHCPPSLADEADEADGHQPGGEVYERLFHWLLDAYFDTKR